MNHDRGVILSGACGILLAGCSGKSGDLPDIRSRGELRVIVRPEPVAFMPRNAEPVNLDRTMVEDLARELDLKLKLVVMENYDRMIGALLEGRGDLISASLTRTRGREARVLFSRPHLHVDELLVTRRGKDIPKKPEDLAGKEICVRKSSSYFETLSELKKGIPSMVVRETPGTLNTEDIVDQVARGGGASPRSSIPTSGSPWRPFSTS